MGRIPAPPPGLVRTNEDLTIGDVDFSSVLTVLPGGKIRIRPEVIEHFPEFRPVLTYVAQSITAVLEDMHSDTAEERIADTAVDRLVRVLNLNLSTTSSTITIRDKYSEKTGFMALTERFNVLDEQTIREIAKCIFKNAHESKLVHTKKEIADACNVNGGQFSHFLNNDGPLALDLVVSVIDYIANTAGPENFAALLDGFTPLYK